MNEIKRLQQLAGINEIKVNRPGIKDGDRVEILVDVYLKDGEAIPKYEFDRDLSFDSLYINKGDTGVYEDGMFESDDGSSTRIEKEYIRRI